MEKLKNIIIWVLLGIIIILSLFKGCGDNSPKTEFIIKRDTVVKTILAPDTVIKFKTKYFPKWDTIYSFVDSSKWSKDLCKFERQYNDSTSDSNVTIFSNIRTIGLLKSSQLSYRLKVPVKIETTIKTDSIIYVPTEKGNKFTIVGYGGVGGNINQLNINVGAAILSKNKYYGYSFDPINRTHNVNFGIILYKSRK